MATISSIIQNFINNIKKPMIQSAMKNDISIVGEYQKEIMGSLDQLDDLLAFTEFKETQTEIIREISQIIQLYLREKKNYDDAFFF